MQGSVSTSGKSLGAEVAAAAAGDEANRDAQEGKGGEEMLAGDAELPGPSQMWGLQVLDGECGGGAKSSACSPTQSPRIKPEVSVEAYPRELQGQARALHARLTVEVANDARAAVETAWPDFRSLVPVVIGSEEATELWRR